MQIFPGYPEQQYTNLKMLFNNPTGRYYSKPPVLSRGPSAFRIYESSKNFRNRLNTEEYAELHHRAERQTLRSRLSGFDIENEGDNESLYDNSEYGVRIGTWKNQTWSKTNWNQHS